MKTIQWYPGHMAKARREIKEKLQMIDVVIELLDARIPMSSQNPIIEELVDQKPRLVLLNKADLADEKQTEQWSSYFRKQGAEVLAINSQTGQGIKKIAPACQKLAHALYEKWEAKGMKPRALRAVILGIPNVGKSTLINRLVNKRQAKVGDRPGVTKQQQWIKVGNQLDLLDTPGILWPKFDDQEVGLRLAATGAIKDELLDYGDVAAFTLRLLAEDYPKQLQNRYAIELPVDSEDVGQLFDEIGKKRGCIVKGGLVDYDKTAELILRELRSGTIGKVTLEKAESQA
ncbi:ribosome biogenesis GTPase A [Alkalihalobacillus xiaoxiensis]|uniref:Ribosome biogenesis GTPase A n=2 Tax=Shouchella xiaoxiensis TaxID=766895 RepID=A0ABS2SS20_9BACI|nr:ribosome biogenesis GTPase A [Shouchella xiaoxiensis]